MSEQVEFVKQIARRLESADIEYMFTGSIAMVFYATPRMTRDIDLVVHLDEMGVEKMVGLFSHDCYIDPESVQRAVARHGMFNIISNALILKADFIVRKPEEYRLVEFSRRQAVELDGQRIFLVAPEDLILSKLIWGKGSESELQLRDIRNLFTSVPSLDREYLRFWAEKLGLAEFMKKALKSA